MTGDKLLSQEEIDLLMNAQKESDADQSTPGEEAPVINGEPSPKTLSDEEKDALGEIGNISMGSASTTLSELLIQKVNITSPRVWLTNKSDLLNSFTVPYLIIKVDFIEGLQGFNLLVMKVHDAAVIADLMMGGDGSTDNTELSEMEISAASEAMNMMIGSASTSLSQIFGKPVNISPPTSLMLRETESTSVGGVLPEISEDASLVIVSFNMTIGDLVDTEIMQVMSVETAKEEAELLLKGLTDTAEEQPVPQQHNIADNDLNELIDSVVSEPQSSQPQPAFRPMQTSGSSPQVSSAPAPRNLDLILDIPLKVSVVLGRTKKPIKEVLNVGPGSVIELDALADEPVEVLVNGTLVAEGSVVVVNENFGVKITNIISPEERIKRLAN